MVLRFARKYRKDINNSSIATMVKPQSSSDLQVGDQKNGQSQDGESATRRVVDGNGLKIVAKINANKKGNEKIPS